MAVNKSWKDKTTGEWKKVTAWVDVTVPTRLMQYTLQKTTYAKGDLALVAGTLATKVAKTKSGEEYTKLFVQAETVANLTKSTSEDTTTAPDTIDASL